MKLVALHTLATAAILSVSVQALAKPINKTSKMETTSVSSNTSLRDLFDRWERVWNEGETGLFDSCVGETYTRHDENGDRTMTRAEYAADMAKIKAERPDIQVIVYDHGFIGDRAWFRFAFQWTDTKSGQKVSRAGLQSYRVSGGKLAETWIAMQPLGSAWHDKPQAHWTSPAPER